MRSRSAPRLSISLLYLRSEGFADRRRQLPTRRIPTEIRRADRPYGEHVLDGGDDPVVGDLFAEMLEHQRRGPDGADRIGDPASRDVRRRAMNRLEHGRVLALRVEIATGRQAQAAGDRRSEVGEDVTKEIGGDDRVECLGMAGPLSETRPRRLSVVSITFFAS